VSTYNSQVQEIRVNGTPAGNVSALDRGLQFGDGLFETIACLNGRPRFLPLHLERLEFGCERLNIAVNTEAIHAEVVAMAAAAQRAVIKLLVTAGEATKRGYARSGQETATCITIRYDWPDEAAARLHDGLMIRTLTLRLGENPRLAGLKHCNRLEQVLARAELAAFDGCTEGLLFGNSGNLVSGTMSNVFLVREGSLLTPRIDRSGVAGVMRRVVLREARQVGVPARECELYAADVESAEEVFLTSALAGIQQVSRVDGRELRLGPVTQHLQSMLTPLLEGPADA
jgi:4-amino-4-deoxychorismate lyase